MKFLYRTGLAAVLVLLSGACAGTGTTAPRSALDTLREEAAESRDAELTARWLLGELVSPGGDAARAARARQKLDQLGGNGLMAHLARGIDDQLHGRLKSAPDHFMKATQAARSSRDRNAELYAWYAAHEAVSLRHHAPGLWERWKPFVLEAAKTPIRIGWRARSELVDFWTDEEYEGAARGLEDLIAEQFGCLKELRLAGPFGRDAPADVFRSFEAEAPGPWPERWTPDPSRGFSPQVVANERHGCFVSAKEAQPSGIYYAETYLDLPEAREVILAVQGSLALWIDDHQVQDRDPRLWGVWPKFGVKVWLEPGRHRVLARLTAPATSIRALTPDGRPAALTSTTQAGGVYTLDPPRVTGDPNVLDAYLRPGGVIEPEDDIVRFVAAALAALEGQGDVASVLHEKLVADLDRASGAALATAASYAQIDPLFDETQVKDLTRELHDRAAKKDPRLWRSRLSVALWHAERSGPIEAIRHVRALLDEFPQVPAIPLALARVYGELGWAAEYATIVTELERRFPEDPEALHLAVEVYDARGDHARADALVERIRKLDPDDEIVLTRALARQDYAAAIRELESLAKRRPERKDLVERLHDVMVRAGNTSETWKKLEAAVEQQPKDPRARLALADAAFASGQHDALRRALVDAVEDGVSTDVLKDAIELVEGTSELEPYRLDGRRIIAEWLQSGRHMPGTAARVLDYSAVWAHADGSSRMLEHEIVQLQSAEAISRFAEFPKNQGLMLRLRVIKKDGRVLEPEDVAGKPTVTFPHLELGDFIETERVISRPGDGQHGQSFVGPQWFFREEDVPYARSEFVVITPKDKPLVIETHGQLPPPTIEQLPAVVVHRWRVDDSPAAPSEPSSAPASEFLPSVRIGWGIDLKTRLRNLSDSVAEVIPNDPRIVRIARRIVDGVPERQPLERARRLYRWVLQNVEHGEETDGRRVVIGKNGNRWRGFTALARALDLKAEFALAQNRLALPPKSPLSEATAFSEPVLRVQTRGGEAAWLTFEPPVANNPASAKNLPFGYLPADVRGMPAYLLDESTKNPRVMVPDGGSPDAINLSGRVQLASDGSAKIELAQTYTGKYAMQLRTGITQLPQAQLRDVLESRLLGQSLRGARLLSHRVEHLDDVDRPLVIRMSASMQNFAQREGKRLVIVPPLMPRLSGLARLPSRQTPLLLGSANHQDLVLEIELPPSAELENRFEKARIQDGERLVVVNDEQLGKTVRLARSIEIPAGRVQPGEYPQFVQFARRVDDALSETVRVRLRE